MAHLKLNPVTGLFDLQSVTSVNGARGDVVLTTSDISEGSNLYYTDSRARLALSGTSPIQYNNTTGNISIQKSDATHDGYLSSSDWSTFNAKLDASSSNYISNSDAEVDTSGWNLYNDSGNTAPAIVVAQDITFTAVAAGNAGNGINIDYIFHPSQNYHTPLVTVLSPTHVTVAWYNGPTVLNNPTATELKAAWDAEPGAVALATATITGSASNLQYITGSNVTANGGDTAPVDGTGGTPSGGVTFTRNTSTPLIGTASFDLGKDAANRQGEGVSTDFTINSIDKNNVLQISFIYQGSTDIVLGSASDIRVFLYDIGNSVLIPVLPHSYISGPVNTAKTFTGTFTSSNSSNYRLILHNATDNALAWDLLLDKVFINDIVSPSAATDVPSLVLKLQPVAGTVGDHQVVMWTDGATQWVKATIASATSDFSTQLGFATNISGGFADIYIRGKMDGFSFGPFIGYNQYIDNTAGQISPLPSPFTDSYVTCGKAITSTTLNVEFTRFKRLVTSKGGLLSNAGANDGTGDQVLAVGTNGSVLIANSAASLGISWAPAVVVAAPFTYTTATRTLAVSSQTAKFFYAAPNASAGVPSFRAIVASDVPTLNQSTTGSAATLTTPRTIAGTSFNGSANIALANKFIVQGTADAGLSGAQFLGALATGLVKNTTTTGVLSTAAATDVTGQLLTGYTLAIGGGTVAATDSILQGLQKLVGQPQVKTGTNGKIGTAVLVGGTVTVANTSVTANSRIFLTSNVDGGTVGFLRVSAKSVGSNFTITSSSGLDTSTVAWLIVESIP